DRGAWRACLGCVHLAESLFERHRPEMAEPEDVAGQLALSAGQDDAASLDLAIERLPVEVVRDSRCGDGLRRMARIGEQLEAESGQPGAGGCGARLVAG